MSSLVLKRSLTAGMISLTAFFVSSDTNLIVLLSSIITKRQGCLFIPVAAQTPASKTASIFSFGTGSSLYALMLLLPLMHFSSSMGRIGKKTMC